MNYERHLPGGARKYRDKRLSLKLISIAAVAMLSLVVSFTSELHVKRLRLNLRKLRHDIKDEVRDEDTPTYIHPSEHALLANIGKYPNYIGRLNPGGWVKVAFHSTSLTVEAGLTGVESEVTAGLHIHEGETCCPFDDVAATDVGASKVSVGDHFYNRQTLLQDPWTNEKGATYTSLPDGTTDPKQLSSGAFHLNQGFTYKENIRHVVVVHDSGGIRVGCGVLCDPEALNDCEDGRFVNGVEVCSKQVEGRTGSPSDYEEEKQ